MDSQRHSSAICSCPKDFRKTVAIPPLDEQQRIVAEIEKQFTRLDAGVASLKRVQTALKRYRASVLKSACEGRLVPTEAELGRKENRSYETGEQLLQRILKERREKWNGKGRYKEPQHPNMANAPQLPEGWTFTSGEQLFTWSSGEGLTQKQIKSGKYPVYGGNGITGYHASFVVEHPTIVIGRVGALCGNVYLTEGAAWITDNAIYATSVPSCCLKFLQVVFENAKLNARAAGSGQPFVNQRMLNETVLPLPPHAEQDRIVADVERRLSVIQELDTVISKALQRAVRIRQSILRSAFEKGDI